ncbi:MAG: hypothetical protein KDI56_07235 [Xanthomonadales bacterium]|nr:hypothetical protein [Xanthomonadales bacterium]MCB1626139.1 hypothetical protein [Xanthomonadales bacterium]
MIKHTLAGSLLALLLSGSAWAGNAEDRAELANQKAESISNADAFVSEIDQSLQLAREGVYGDIKAADMERLQQSRDKIATLLDGHATATELHPDQRIELYNAQELIISIIRNDDKNRKVCERVKQAGSRVTKRECLTVAEREQRARAARDAAARMQRVDCVPGVGNPCGR